MTNLPQVFQYEGRQVRTLIINDQPWFVAKDVCEILEISNTGDALSRLDGDEKNTIALTDGTPGNPNMAIVNEPGLYSLILGSRKPEARAFKRWVTHEVLPQIRKTGSYSLVPRTFAEALRLAADQAEQIEQQQKQLIEAKPKVEFYDHVTGSKDAIEIGKVAKVLAIPGIGRNNLFAILRDKGVLMSGNVPKQEHIDHGRFRVIEQKWTTPEGETRISIKTLVYQKGVDYIRRLLTKETQCPAS